MWVTSVCVCVCVCVFVWLYVRARVRVCVRARHSCQTKEVDMPVCECYTLSRLQLESLVFLFLEKESNLHPAKGDSKSRALSLFTSEVFKQTAANRKEWGRGGEANRGTTESHKKKGTVWKLNRWRFTAFLFSFLPPERSYSSKLAHLKGLFKAWHPTN